MLIALQTVLFFFLASSGSVLSKVVPQKLELLFEDSKSVNFGDPQLELYKLDKIDKFGCFSYWLNSSPMRDEITALTLDKHNGQKTKFVFVFQNARTSSAFGFERDKKNKTIRIISKDIKKDLKKDSWIYIQLCFNSKKFLPYIFYPGGELKTDKYQDAEMGNTHYSTAYFFGDGKKNELDGNVLTPYYTRGLLLDNLPNMRNFGISKHHAILNLIQNPLSDYNNLQNQAPGVGPELEVAYAKYNGTHYGFASGEYSYFYPDMNIGQDTTAIAPQKNAVIVKGVQSKGLPAKTKSFRMTVNIRVRIPKNYMKSKGREYETEIPTLYRWMTKDHETLFKCEPEFKVKKGSDKTTWTYGEDPKSDVNKVTCTMKLDSGKGSFTFDAGKGDMYFMNLIIASEDGINLRFGTDSTPTPKRIKLADKDEVYPKKDDMHLFGELSGNNLDEPSPYTYEYELINIHTGFVVDRIAAKSKKGYEKYKVFKNKPMVALTPLGIDAINCKEGAAASFYNGKNFACLKYLNLDSQRSMKLTNETDAITRNHFKDWSCNKHRTFKSDGSCAACPKYCDVCSEFGLCDVCVPGYRTNDEKTGCIKCTDDEVHDVVTKKCYKREKNSEKVAFKDWKDNTIISKVVKGPEIHGLMMILQGKIVLSKKKKGTTHKMYEKKTDPMYPDDNVMIIFRINDIDVEVYEMNLRNQEGHERPFYISVPVPRNSKIKFKFVFSQFANSKDYAKVAIKGFSYEKLAYKANYSKHRQTSHVSVLDIEVGTPKKTTSQLVNKILDYTGLAITDFNELTTRLMHINELDESIQKKIKDLHLNLNAARTRCENVHENCVELWGTMAVKACPKGYERVGCCKCTLPCDTARGFEEDGLFCHKPKAYTTKNHKYSTLDDCIAGTGNSDFCELHGNRFYTKKCAEQFLRSGDYDCIPLCPFGWPDYGDKCGKVGTIYTGMPSVWLPGDQPEYTG